jgi:hypothetical protein
MVRTTGAGWTGADRRSNYPTGCGTAAKYCTTYFYEYRRNLWGDGQPFMLIGLWAWRTAADLQGGIVTNWNSAALVDSYVDDVHKRI